MKIHLGSALSRCSGKDASQEGICDFKALSVVPSDSYGGTEVGILLCMLVALRTMVYVALRYRARE